MAAPTSKAAKTTTAAKQPEQVTPPYYIAEQPLFIGKFGRAHNPGDLVPVEHVERYGWTDKVRAPDGYDAPKQQTTTDEPESPDSGQATSEGKDA